VKFEIGKPYHSTRRVNYFVEFDKLLSTTLLDIDILYFVRTQEETIDEMSETFYIFLNQNNEKMKLNEEDVSYLEEATGKSLKGHEVGKLYRPREEESHLFSKRIKNSFVKVSKKDVFLFVEKKEPEELKGMGMLYFFLDKNGEMLWVERIRAELFLEKATL